MQWNTIETNWAAYVPRLMTRWPDLDEDTLLTTDGDLGRVSAHLAQKETVEMAEAREMLTAWADGSEPADAVMDATRDNARITESARNIPVGEDVYADDAKFGADPAPATPKGRN